MSIRSALAGAALVSLTLVAPALASTALINADVPALNGPGTQFGADGSFVANSKVGVLWCGSDKFDWCLVRYHEKAGWVHSGDLSMLGPDGIPLDGGSKYRGHGKGGTDSVMPDVAEPSPASGPGVHPTPGVIKAIGGGL